MDWLQSIVSSLLVWVESLGYFGIIIGLAIEVIPSEIVLAFGGYLVSQGQISFLGAVLCGTLGALLQQWILYGIGYFAGRPFFEKYGKYIKIKPKHLDKADQWFKQYGAGIVFTARFVPVMRQVISVPAGITKMNFGFFSLLTLIASIPWSLLFVFIGNKLGDNWENFKEVAEPYVQPAILIALALLIVYIMVKVLRKRGKSV